MYHSRARVVFDVGKVLAETSLASISPVHGGKKVREIFPHRSTSVKVRGGLIKNIHLYVYHPRARVVLRGENLRGN